MQTISLQYMFSSKIGGVDFNSNIHFELELIITELQ